MIQKKIAAGLTALLAACCLLSAPALAAEARGSVIPGDLTPKSVHIRCDSAPDVDNNTLFSAYITGRFFASVNAGVSPASVQDPAGDRLKEGAQKTLYALLKEKIEYTARHGGSAAYSFTSEDLGLKTQWTLDELETLEYTVPEAPNASEDSENPEDQKEWTEYRQAINAIFSGLYVQAYTALDSAAVERALLADCPFDLYWFDKTAGSLFVLKTAQADPETGEGGASFNGEILSMPLVYSFYFTVAGGYQAEDNVPPNPEESNPGDPVVTAEVGRVEEAAETAAGIVALHQGESDYDKLLSYKDAICRLTAYNDDAASGGAAYGDPWQLIYVFDGDEDTTVVCEGYSKAFQYLCDLSQFDDANCYTVSGLMQGGTGDGKEGKAGPHMWNIVRIGGKSYLVDVTNCDEDSAGQNGGLFLAGAALYTETDPTGYDVTLPGDHHIYYWYGELHTDGDGGTIMIPNEMLDVWDGGVLALAEESYQPQAERPRDAVSTVETNGSGSVSAGGWAREAGRLLLGAAYGPEGRFIRVNPHQLSAAGSYEHTFALPTEAQSFRAMLLAGGETSWTPLCQAKGADV